MTLQRTEVFEASHPTKADHGRIDEAQLLPVVKSPMIFPMRGHAGKI